MNADDLDGDCRQKPIGIPPFFQMEVLQEPTLSQRIHRWRSVSRRLLPTDIGESQHTKRRQKRQ